MPLVLQPAEPCSDCGHSQTAVARLQARAAKFALADMDGIKIASRTLSETAALRICEYDACGQRMAGCLADNTLAVFDRTGGHSLWECSSSWPAGTARVTQVSVGVLRRAFP